MATELEKWLAKLRKTDEQAYEREVRIANENLYRIQKFLGS